MYKRDDVPLCVLLMGEPGAGKTTAIGHLLDKVEVQTGKPFELRILDFDGKLDPIATDAKRQDRGEEALSRVSHVSLELPCNMSENGTMVASDAGAAFRAYQAQFRRFVSADGPDDPYDQWPRNRVLVIDDLSGLAELLWQFELMDRAAGSRVGGELRVGSAGDVGAVQTLIWNQINLWTRRAKRNFHIVVACHVAPLSLNLARFVTDDTLEEASKSQAGLDALKSAAFGRDAKEGKTKLGNALETVQTVKLYPLLPGKQLQNKFLSRFHTVFVERGPTGVPRIRTRACARYDARVPLDLEDPLVIDGLDRVLNKRRTSVNVG